MSKSQELQLLSITLTVLSKTKTVLEMAIYAYDNSKAADKSLHKEDSFHAIYSESKRAYQAICKVEDLILGSGTIEHKYRFDALGDVNHLKIIK